VAAPAGDAHIGTASAIAPTNNASFAVLVMRRPPDPKCPPERAM